MPADPLWLRRGEAAEPERAIASVHAFLLKCRAWGSDLQIPELLQRLEEDPTVEDASRLHQWTSWVAFVDHALRELEDGTLDGWFEDEL